MRDGIEVYKMSFHVMRWCLVHGLLPLIFFYYSLLVIVCGCFCLFFFCFNIDHHIAIVVLNPRIERFLGLKEWLGAHGGAPMFFYVLGRTSMCAKVVSPTWFRTLWGGYERGSCARRNWKVGGLGAIGGAPKWYSVFFSNQDTTLYKKVLPRGLFTLSTHISNSRVFGLPIVSK